MRGLEALYARYENHAPGLLGVRRNYAVLCPLVERNGEPHVLLEVRAKELRQGGEVCFPGGAMEAGETAAELDAVRRKVAEHIRTGHNISMEAYITDARYGYIRGLLRDGVVRQDAGKDRLALSDKLDKVLTNAFFGPLIMLAVLYALFYVTIEVGACCCCGISATRDLRSLSRIFGTVT